MNVKIIWQGPDAETNIDQQMNIVDDAVNRGVDGIVLAPCNKTSLVRPVESAIARGVPIVVIDSSLDSKQPVSVISTDNYAAGQQAAEALIKAMGPNRPFGGKVIILRFVVGSGSTEAAARLALPTASKRRAGSKSSLPITQKTPAAPPMLTTRPTACCGGSLRIHAPD